ncbi:hypothetical protein Mapa_008434 [Marchantia paleacea]|nr:hypothetical protein Mapa_008434 [Marchantia paleacea]
MAIHMPMTNDEARFSIASSKEAKNLSIGESMMLDYIVPMAMKAILQLGVPDILGKASGPTTVEQIVSQLKCKSSTDAAVNLQRILSFLARKGVFTVSSDCQYPLTDLGEMFASNHEFSLVPYAKLLVHNAVLEPFKYLPGGILTNSVPRDAAHGLSIYAEHPQYPDWAATFNTGLVGSTQIIAGRVAAEYPGFKTVKSVVDVGGGLGLPFVSLSLSTPIFEASIRSTSCSCLGTSNSGYAYGFHLVS